MNGNTWVDWCCLVCRRWRHTVAWVAEFPEPCRHTGTSQERSFWAHAGEPNIYVIADDEARREAVPVLDGPR